MAKFIEKDTLVPVDIRGLQPFRGGLSMSIITWPDGSELSIVSDQIYEHFDIVTPQVITMSGSWGGAYQRDAPLPEPQAEQVLNGNRVISAEHPSG